MKRIWIWDLEVLPTIFTATFIDRDSNEKRVFVITKEINNSVDLLFFLKQEVQGLIGYNSLKYDSQIIEYFMKHPLSTPEDIRFYSDKIINSEDQPDYSEWKLTHTHLDLYKVNHFDNKNRRTGLKWCEFGMDLENIEDMPEDGTLEQILQYNLNDVIATKKLLEYTEPLLQVRRDLKKLYNIKCMNYSNTKLGSEILLNLYCEKTGRDKREVRGLRTYRPIIKISEVIFPYISFKSREFNELLKLFNSLEFTKTKKEEDISFYYKNFEFVYGKGGIHGSVNKKLVESDSEYIILDADVASLYPSIAIMNGLYPQHLGKEFCDIYKKEIVDVRLAEKDKKENGNKAIVEGFKEAANATYGNSNQIYSWLYDPKYTMATTINGQLMLTMLAEELMDLPKSNLLQINTDGLTLKFLRKDIDKYYDICNRWMKLTKLQLEYVEYSKMVIFDVNNYLGIYSNGKVKTKGRCEFKNIPLHKNKSHSIIPLAFYEYWVNNIPVEKTIKNHINIFDFCAGVKAKSSPAKGKSHYELHWVEKGEYKQKKLSKTVRYYISKAGATLIKKYEDGTFGQVEAPIMKGNKLMKEWKVTYFNKYYSTTDFQDYKIDYSYYIFRAKSWIEAISDMNQLRLF